MKRKYYILWIEGLSPKTGDKIKTLTSDSRDYTTRMTQALRIRPEDTDYAIELLRKQGVSDWTLQNCLVETSYAPAGTVWKSLTKTDSPLE